MEDPREAYSGVYNLSRLPDELISRILSLLCTEDAVRTSVLSTSWRYLCTSISNLDLKFNSRILKNTDEQDCMNFVDRFLFYRKKCAIDKFELKWNMSQALDPLRLKNWIEVVLSHGIRELDLCIYGFEMQDLLLPSSLFTCNSLEVLKLNIWKSGYSRTNYVLELPARVCLPSLKSTRLRNVSFSEDSWSRLFPNCPILEEFFFNFERGCCKLSVSSPMLRRLTIEQKYGLFDLFVDAPSLVYLGVSTSEPISIRLVKARSLVEANIKVFQIVVGSFRSIDVCSELVTGISNIQTLRISIASLSFLMLRGAIQIPALQNMTHLTLFDCNRSLPALPCLLEKCEYLETLVFEDLCEWRSWDRVEESRICCLTSVVKTIKVCEFMGKKSELELVNYFLKTARVLERMEIHLGSQCENPSKIANELQKLPKILEALMVMDVIF